MAFGGGLIGCRSSTRGFRSIISVWLRRVSITVARVIPGGRGVNVVNTVLFDILNVGKCFRYRMGMRMRMRMRMRICLSRKDLEVVVEKNVLEEAELEVRHIHRVKKGDKLRPLNEK